MISCPLAPSSCSRTKKDRGDARPRNKDGARNFGTFRDPVSLCSQKFDRVEGLLSRERVEVDEI